MLSALLEGPTTKYELFILAHEKIKNGIVDETGRDKSFSNFELQNLLVFLLRFSCSSQYFARILVLL